MFTSCIKQNLWILTWEFEQTSSKLAFAGTCHRRSRSVWQSCERRPVCRRAFLEMRLARTIPNRKQSKKNSFFEATFVQRCISIFFFPFYQQDAVPETHPLKPHVIERLTFRDTWSEHQESYSSCSVNALLWQWICDAVSPQIFFKVWNNRKRECKNTRLFESRSVSYWPMIRNWIR